MPPDAFRPSQSSWTPRRRPRPTRQPVPAVPPSRRSPVADEPPLPPWPVAPGDSPPAAAESAGDQERESTGGHESRDVDDKEAWKRSPIGDS